MVYLAGPGHYNEHSEPHLVGGDPAMMAWYDDNQLDRDSALAIARHLDRPRRAFGVEIKGGHVWHCSLSLRADEGKLTDEKWRTIAEAFMSKMGLDDCEGAKAPTRWVAVHHGQSSDGNDHIHIAVNLVREDGTRASVHDDYGGSQKACRELEREFGLVEVGCDKRPTSSRGYHPAERAADARRRARGRFEGARRAGAEKRSWWSLDKAERDGLIAAQLSADQPRWALARKVRACATSAADEAEFVRRMRRQGVLVRARYAEGTQDVITGYSVAAKPEPGQRPIWYGGGHLAHDLALPRLRAEWPDTAAGAMNAAAEWNAARRGRRPVAPGREMQEPAPELWREVGTDLERLREQLRSVPIDDRETWAQVARHTAGAFAAWSCRVEDTPGPLAATSDALARTAELRRRPLRAERASHAAASGAALLLISASRAGQGTAAQLVLLRQLANLAKAIHDMHRAAGDARQAAAIAATVRGQLSTVGTRLEADHRAWQAAEAARRHPQAATAIARAQAGQAPHAGAGSSPIPATLTPRSPRRDVGTPGRPGDPVRASNESGR